MAGVANSSQLKEAFQGQISNRLRVMSAFLGEIVHDILTDSGNSERVRASTFDIDENALVVMGARFLRDNPPSTASVQGLKRLCSFLRIDIDFALSEDCSSFLS